MRWLLVVVGWLAACGDNVVPEVVVYTPDQLAPGAGDAVEDRGGARDRRHRAAAGADRRVRRRRGAQHRRRDAGYTVATLPARIGFRVEATGRER